MQFKYPEILWALLLLLIPILVHLFQLRRFQKVPFTNVKFLRAVTIQTRKSSQIKKWLVLFTRMLAITALVIAFAQPYLADRDLATSKKETVIYLDNSFSMQAKEKGSSILEGAIQDLIESVPEDARFTLFTNDKTYLGTSIAAIRNDLLQLPFSPTQLSLDAVLFKGNTFFSDDATDKDLIVISDFQQKDETLQLSSETSTRLRWVQLAPQNRSNISIDSAYVSRNDAVNLELTVTLSSQESNEATLPISLYDNERLIAKTAVSFENENSASTIFTLPAGKAINGHLEIDDNALVFDNHLFFNINAPEKINVLAINQDNDDFLKRIFTDDEFELEAVALDQLDYALISTQNLIVLNELTTVPTSLASALKAFTANGGWVSIIPAKEIDLRGYNDFLKNHGLGTFGPRNDSDKRITTIAFDHPLFQGVFESNVRNFQYPKVQSSLESSMISGRKILSFEDDRPLLVQNGNYYLFTASINKENSNFKNSPLIVPTMYNMGRKSLQLSKLYYTIGANNVFDIRSDLQEDQILSIETRGSSFIPLQQNLNNKTRITTTELPREAGIFDVKNKQTVLQQISFNYDRDESKLVYHDIAGLFGQEVANSVATMFDTLKSESRVNELWKWFVIFALLSLVIEMLILKFFK
ncbi:BatA domain-containing protein [Sungkyunkwania multivorans]|uniref:BatA domain-containing protein n=1 Tax=Sungkyunkwania multivorans TaxID=1173618 RepID=A0ABW3CYA1_9FLAO